MCTILFHFRRGGLYRRTSAEALPQLSGPVNSPDEGSVGCVSGDVLMSWLPGDLNSPGVLVLSGAEEGRN